MRDLTTRLLMSAFVLILMGCEPEVVTVYEDIYIDHPLRLTINFPFEDSFLYSSNANILIFNITEEERNICPVLHNLIVLGAGEPREADLESNEVPVCDLRDPDSVIGGEEEGFTFNEIDVGLRAFFVVVYDTNNAALLSGCVVDEVMLSENPDDPFDPIVVRLYTTSGYVNAIDLLPELSCSDMDEKCSRGC